MKRSSVVQFTPLLPSRAPREAQDDHASLYRHFGEDGTLLYVGISISALSRLSEHKKCSHWFRSIRRVEIEHFPTREGALTAEAEAIAREKPKFNMTHNGALSVVVIERAKADGTLKKLSDSSAFSFGFTRAASRRGTLHFEKTVGSEASPSATIRKSLCERRGPSRSPALSLPRRRRLAPSSRSKSTKRQ